jgi:hypothetical protein
MRNRFIYYWLTTFSFITLLFSACIAKSIDKEKQFWDWFVANKERLYEQLESQEKLFDELAEQLHKVDPNLMFEFSPVSPDSIREFTISADGIKQYFPIVESLVSNAPQIDKWKISAFRQRIPGDDMTIKYDSLVKISYDNIYFRYAHDSGKIALELNVENLIDSPGFKNAVYILLDGLIGEYDMETQISSIEFILLDTNKIPTLSPLVALRNVVDKNKELSLK